MKLTIEIDTEDLAKTYEHLGYPQPKNIEKFIRKNLQHFTGPMRAALYNAVGHCLWYDYNFVMQSSAGDTK